MSKPVVQLHTIDQWFQVDPQIRALILKNLKLKDRLWKFLGETIRMPAPTEPFWAPCKKCDRRGWYEVHPRYPGIHPSQINNDCMLRLYNDVVGIEGQQRHEARMQLVFDLGHAVHAMFQSYGLKGAWGPYYIPEAPINGELQQLAEMLMIEGHADADTIITVDIEGSPVIYEVGVVHEYKTINTHGFSKLTRPKPEHLRQALIYSACLNRPVVAYLYFDKNDSNLVDFPVEFNPELWRIISAKIQMMVDFYKRGVAPQGDPGYHCQECPYVNSCHDYRESMTRRRG